MDNLVLGIHGGVTNHQHDSSICLMRDGEILFAAEEERYRRQKGASGCLPIQSIKHCLSSIGISLSDIDCVVTPGITYNDIIERTSSWLYHHFDFSPRIEVIHHQEAHLYSLLPLDPPPDACFLSSDAYGDGLSGMIGVLNSCGMIDILDSIEPSQSLGRLYALFTSYMGYRQGEDEYKLMGLSALGNSNKVDLEFINSQVKNLFHCTESYFSQWKPSQDEAFYTSKLHCTINSSRRLPGSKFTDQHADFAAAVQHLYEENLLLLIKHALTLSSTNKVYMAGGTALNCLANYHLRPKLESAKIVIHPAASDRGLSMGCAAYGSLKAGHQLRPLRTLSLGSHYKSNEIISFLTKCSIPFHKSTDSPSDIAHAIQEGKVVGLLQGKSEFGPRALGNRSILASPTISNMKDTLNLKIKFRESYRPFAAICPLEVADYYFSDTYSAPYMTEIFKALPETIQSFPSIVHADGTCRVQTITESSDYYILSIFAALATINHPPLLINTSFNLSGEPIVESPADAVRSFFSSGIDILFIEDLVISKVPQLHPSSS